jgi:hypothetical protein
MELASVQSSFDAMHSQKSYDNALRPYPSVLYQGLRSGHIPRTRIGFPCAIDVCHSARTDLHWALRSGDANGLADWI